MSDSFNFGALFSGRDVIGSTLHEIGLKNDKLYVVTSDIGGALKDFKRDLPTHYIDTGIARLLDEQIVEDVLLVIND